MKHLLLLVALLLSLWAHAAPDYVCEVGRSTAEWHLTLAAILGLPLLLLCLFYYVWNRQRVEKARR